MAQIDPAAVRFQKGKYIVEQLCSRTAHLRGKDHAEGCRRKRGCGETDRRPAVLRQEPDAHRQKKQSRKQPQPCARLCLPAPARAQCAVCAGQRQRCGHEVRRGIPHPSAVFFQRRKRHAGIILSAHILSAPQYKSISNSSSAQRSGRTGYTRPQPPFSVCVQRKLISCSSGHSPGRNGLACALKYSTRLPLSRP